MEKSRLPPCSPTVPSGDTPCVTAGDAQRVNPWREKPSHPPTPAVSHSIHTCYSPSTLAVRRFLRRIVVLSLVHGFSLAPLGHHPRLSMVRLRRRRGICRNNCLRRRSERSCSTTVETNYSSLFRYKTVLCFSLVRRLRPILLQLFSMKSPSSAELVSQAAKRVVRNQRKEVPVAHLNSTPFRPYQNR